MHALFEFPASKRTRDMYWQRRRLFPQRRRFLLLLLAALGILVSELLYRIRTHFIRPSSSLEMHSTHKCYATRAESPVCFFKNVCVTTAGYHTIRELSYFLPVSIKPQSKSDLARYNLSGFLDSSVHLTLRPSALTERNQGKQEPYHFLKVKPTSHDSLHDITWLDTPAVLYSPYWPENWGHAVFDDLYSIWCAIHIFGVESKAVNIYHSGFPFEEDDMKTRSEETYGAFAARIGMSMPQRLQIRNDNSAPSGTVACFKELVVGTGTLSMSEYPYRIQDFARVMRESRRPSFPMIRIRRRPARIVFVDKTDGKHKRRIRNLDILLAAAKKTFPSAVIDVLDSKRLTCMTLDARLKEMHGIDILVVPSGAASFNALFMRPETALVVLEVYEPSSNSSVALEPYIWNSVTDVRTFFFHVTERNMLVTSESSERPKNDPLYRDFLFRDFADYLLPVEDLMSILKVAWESILPASYVP